MSASPNKRLLKDLEKALNNLSSIFSMLSDEQQEIFVTIKNLCHSNTFCQSDKEIRDALEELDHIVQMLGDQEQQKILESLPLNQK